MASLQAKSFVYLCLSFYLFICVAHCFHSHHHHDVGHQHRHRRLRNSVRQVVNQTHPYHAAGMNGTAGANSTMGVNGTFGIMADDPYSCSASKPCSNGACCGASGFCGYGPTYCGNGCLSNCNAVAECGKYASPAGKQCSLNVCCSEFGFCGTTSEFCGSKCQSNCISNPSPPGGSPTGKLLSRGLLTPSTAIDVLTNSGPVIGYYEAWSARSTCHQSLITDLPLNALTHLNFAFAFISPGSFQITTMDAQTPASLFADVAKAKNINPAIQLFISIGGWTFSDNGTETQPVFGNIARSAANRQTFSNNLLSFMNTYGFDGVDIDWEYPGAPDRGGKDDEVKNFVELLKTMRQTFDGSGRKLGITFTIPSSFWYLRWFDVPALLKYADWTNLMSYDLHGTWDAGNAIGNKVLAHTNLTEIKMATELLWRVNVKPSQVAIGFGFYGRAFTLANPSCTSPGCPFSGGAKKGVCTGTSGYLAYYEVQDILKKNPSIKPVHDKTAAVKYFTWDNDQWIAYDDAETFKQKVDWGNSVGFGGSLIWASDLDDYTFTAHAGLLGKSIKPNIPALASNDLNVRELSDNWNGQLLQGCYRFEECVDPKNPQSGYCGRNEYKVGYDKMKANGKDCGKGYERPICCPKATAPKTCIWRGNPSECNGQCHGGEIGLFKSNRGGSPTEGNEKQCTRGEKIFCCEPNIFDDLNNDCYWTSGCNNKCKADEWDVAYAWDRSGWCTVVSHGSHYCCSKKRPQPFLDCHWVGKGDCADNTCGSSEVVLATDNRGDTYGGCSWNRKKSLCCTPNQQTVQAGRCDYTLCEVDPEDCIDDYGDPINGVDGFNVKRSIGDNHSIQHREHQERSLVALGSYHDHYEYEDGTIEKRVAVKLGKDFINVVKKLPPSAGDLFTGPNAKVVVRAGFRLATNKCSAVAVEVAGLADIIKGKLYPGFAAEHFMERQWIPMFAKTLDDDVLPSGAKAAAGAINKEVLRAAWSVPLPINAADLPKIGVSTDKILTNINDRLFETIGTKTNRLGMFLADADLNRVKGILSGLKDPISAQKFKSLVWPGLMRNDPKVEAYITKKFQATIATFNYMNSPLTQPQFALNRLGMQAEWNLYGSLLTGCSNLGPRWAEFEKDLYVTIATRGATWVTNNMAAIELFLKTEKVDPNMVIRILGTFAEFRKNIFNMKINVPR